MKSALLIIDMINDFNFTHGDMLYTHTKSIINPILHLKTTMKKQKLPIIYINDHYTANDALYAGVSIMDT